MPYNINQLLGIRFLLRADHSIGREKATVAAWVIMGRAAHIRLPRFERGEL